MASVVEGLEPVLLWKHFDKLRKIPRCSKQEKGAIDYVISVAKELGLDHIRDEAGNAVVKKPATPGHENAPGIVLQAHVDMVCEKNRDVDFDFEKDPIKLEIDGEYLTAKGTTLGADDGMGVCAALAVLEDGNVVHGPLEALFTIDEETGLTGAFALGGDMLDGRHMINLDTEEERALYVGCAGGGDSKLHVPVVCEGPDKGMKALSIDYSGRMGGHSGVDIHLERANAIKLLGRILWEAREDVDFDLSDIHGGDKHNAIPREITALLVTQDPKKLKERIEHHAGIVMEEYRSVEPDMKIEVEETDLPASVISAEDTGIVLNLIQALPDGILRWSPDIEGLVETSTNLAVVRVDENVFLHLSSRSSSDTQLEAVREMIRALGRMAGADVEEGDAYPGWLPDLESKVLATLKESAVDLWGKEPEVKAIHAGLETGIIGKKFPGMDMASIGPQIEFPHSPDERVRIPSVKDFYDLLLLTLKKLA